MRPIYLLLPLSLAACATDIRIGPKDSDLPIVEDTDVAIAVNQPDIEISPPELLFGSLPPHCPGDMQDVTIKNVGQAMLKISSIKLDGAGANAFDIGQAGAINLKPGQETTLSIGFEALDYVKYEKVKIVVVSNDPDEATVRVPVRGEGANAAFREDLFIQESASSVDVLWIIDNSGSMSDTIAKVGQAMNTFITSFSNLGLDYQVAVVTTDMLNALESGRFLGPVIKASTYTQNQAVAEFVRQTNQGSAGSADEKGFDASKAALSAPLVTGTNSGFLRSNATLAVVVVSDEDDYSGITANAYSTWLKQLKADPDDVSFSGMVGPRSGGLSACGGGVITGTSASAAPKYHDAISSTYGVWGNLCNFDINPFLTHLAYVAAGLEFRFELSAPPLSTSPSAITVTVGGRVIAPGAINGWTYDAATNSIQLHGTAIADPGEDIVIRFPFDSGCGN